MKYIIFKQGNLYQPVIFADHTNHCDVILKNATPISAGFVQIDGCMVTKVYGKSDSLNLKNNGDFDKNLLNDLLLNSGTYAFINLF